MDDSIGTYKTNTGGNISSLEMLDEPKIKPFSTKNGYIFKYIIDASYSHADHSTSLMVG